MTPEEAARLNELCKRLFEESDHEKFIELVNELNDLLERKEAILNPHSHKPKPN